MKETETIKGTVKEVIERAKQRVREIDLPREPTTYKKKTKTYILRTSGKSTKNKAIEVTWGDMVIDKGYTLVPNALIDLYQKIGIEKRQLIFILVILRYGFSKGQAFPSQKTIQAKTGYSVRTVKRIIKELKMKGYITVYRRYIKPEGENPRRTSNVYDLTGLMNKIRVVLENEKK